MKFHVPEMSCGHCKAAIETAVTAAGGTVQVDLDSRSVTIAGLNPDRAKAVLGDAGYAATPA